MWDIFLQLCFVICEKQIFYQMTLTFCFGWIIPFYPILRCFMARSVLLLWTIGTTRICLVEGRTRGREAVWLCLEITNPDTWQCSIKITIVKINKWPGLRQQTGPQCGDRLTALTMAGIIAQLTRSARERGNKVGRPLHNLQILCADFCTFHKNMSELV